jgi:diguanylate cyclase (GGDEF)-like protein
LVPADPDHDPCGGRVLSKVLSMSEQKSLPVGRTLLAGKIISNYGQSSIDCVVRRISERGATLTTQSPLGIPSQFHLLIPGEGPPRPCKLIWQSGEELGLEFEVADTAEDEPLRRPAAPERQADSMMRGQMLALRAALDEIRAGVILLDSDLRAQFINREFRKMWALPDQVADSKPSFVALMYHGRDTGAYQIAPVDMDAYVAGRIRQVRDGDTAPRDVRTTNGEVLRVQCAVLPNGGRMISYVYVTDIVRHADELALLHTALDNISDGVLLLDADLKVQFLNRKLRQFWGISKEQAAHHPTYLELIRNAPDAGSHQVAPDKREEFLESRVEAIRSATPAVRDAKLADGRTIRVHCSITANGGRMLTYCDVTDLIRNAEMLEKLATIDSMTGLCNRRHFLSLAEGEWSRFQRYQRPLSLLAIDIDHFKSVNDRYGHAVGDEAIVSVANACQQGRRASDIVGRLGGEEFVMLLPETDQAQAMIVAERLRDRVAAHILHVHQVQFRLTISLGVAQAAVSMSGIDALLRSADQALYRAKNAGRNRVETWSPRADQNIAAE